MSHPHFRPIAFLLMLITLSASEARAEHSPSAPVASDGTINVPAFAVPLSQYMSEPAKARFMYEMQHGLDLSKFNSADPDYAAKLRVAFDDWLRPKIERAKRQYAVRIEQEVISGIRAHVVTPERGIPAKNRNRILINLHGGGFMVGAGLHGIAESIPVASIGGFKVLTIDYRMAPEHRFPAASEDVAAVYTELLKRHASTQIGIFGCSAGGTLSSMAVSWFQRQDLPAPGAIALLSAAAYGSFYPPGTAGSWSGDSAYVSRPLIGQKPLVLNDLPRLQPDSYLSNVDLSDRLVSPALWPEVLAKFPPTLLITGTRAWDLSATIQTQRELVKAGAEADLHLWDGMGHCFILEEDLPESQEAYDVLVRFFDRHLSKT